MKNRKSTRRTKNLVVICTLTAIILVVSTYAWFTSQKDITISNIRGTVEVIENMEKALK